jgi:hypothetical protein
MRFVRGASVAALMAGLAGLVIARRRRPAYPDANAYPLVTTPPTPAPQVVPDAVEPAGTPEAAEPATQITPSPAEPVAEPVAEVPAAEAPAAQPAHLAYLPHLQRYHDDVDQDALRGIVRHCGIALRSKDASLVSSDDPAELARVRDGFLKKKLALEQPDEELDAALADVMQRMAGDRAKSRVTVYYLLAHRFEKLDLFR